MLSYASMLRHQSRLHNPVKLHPKEKIAATHKRNKPRKIRILTRRPKPSKRKHCWPKPQNKKRQKSLLDSKPTGIVPVDHAFNVKGVGVVILGVVTNGIIQKHAMLKFLPAGKTAQVRSIQKHDDEFDVAGEGDRVGLALKNIEVEDLDRGAVLTNDPAIKTSIKLESQASLVKYWQTPIKQGMVMHVGHWTQFITAKVEGVTESSDPKKPILTLTLKSRCVYCSKDSAVLMYLEGPKLRITGTLQLP